MTILELKNITKNLKKETNSDVIRDINLSIDEGEFIAIMGPSGSGKSTLLKIIASLIPPTSGTVVFGNEAMSKKDKEVLSEFRRKELGFIFQNFNLLPTLTVIENIMIPLTLERENIKGAQKKAEILMRKLDILKLKNERIFNLSGGESQRVAICRALIHHPRLLLADEPTVSLDFKSAQSVLNILKEVNENEKLTTLMVTHDAYAASFCSKVIFIQDGQLYKHMIYRGGRKEFYQEILNVLSNMGDKKHELL